MNNEPSWTAERAREWRRQYKRKRRLDPSIRARDNRINRESAERARDWKRYQYWAKFPYGYQVPPGYEDHEVFIDFQQFIESIIMPGIPNLSALYWQSRFDPRCEDAEQRWETILSEFRRTIPGIDPLQKFKERANRLIRNKTHLPSPTATQ